MQRPAENQVESTCSRLVHEQFRFLDLVDDPFFPQEAASVLATFGDLNPMVDSRSEESVFARKIQATVILSGRVDIVRATSYLRIRHLGVLLFYDESTSL